MALIYIVEDDDNIREIESIALSNSGHDVTGFACGKDFKKELAKRKPGLILLDIMLPVTAKSTELDKVKGLDIGADDYITKPFGVMELISRVRALIRRSMDAGAEKSIRVGNIFLDSDRHIVYVDDEPKDLTFKEYELLRCLMNNSGVAMHRERIMELVWGVDFEGESRTLDMHIKTLRQKLGSAGAMIKTVRNVGYVLEP